MVETAECPVDAAYFEVVDTDSLLLVAAAVVDVVLALRRIAVVAVAVEDASSAAVGLIAMQDDFVGSDDLEPDIGNCFE